MDKTLMTEHHSSQQAAHEPKQLEYRLDVDGSSHDDDEVASLSGSAHHSSGPDDILFDGASSHQSSPRTSHGSIDHDIDDEDNLSVVEADQQTRKEAALAAAVVLQSSGAPRISGSSKDTPPVTPSSSSRQRSTFHHPSSVRAMQTETTPPHLSTPSSRPRQRLYTPSRQTTPRSARSRLSGNDTTTITKKEYPLVLLHVTLLPLPTLRYTPEVLEAVLPASVMANWKQLEEKGSSTILDRGVLIPHPREDYDLLEERLLESLELRQPRILKCGHFRLAPEEEADILHEGESDEDDHDGATELDLCDDCGRPIRDGRYGDAGSGSKRWDIKIYAANGLMRAGAWGAAWREMERVDVEVRPWMEEKTKRELELRQEEEDRRRQVEMMAQSREEGIGGLDDERLREIYGHNAQDYVDGLMEMNDTAERDRSHRSASAGQVPEQRPREGMSFRSTSRTVPQSHDCEIPLTELLQKHFWHMMQDWKNVVILVLSLIVLVFAIVPTGSSFPDVASKTPMAAASGTISSSVSSITQSMSASPTDPASQSPSSTWASVGDIAIEHAAGAVEDVLEGIGSTTGAKDEGSPREWTEHAEDELREMLED